METKKRLLAVLLAGAMLAGTSVTALAAENFGPDGNGVLQPDGSVTHEPTEEQKSNGHTTFSILEAKQNPNNVSFTVPLYVTMAVIDGQTKVLTPTNYSITNTSQTSGVNEGGKTPFDIAVVRMDFTKLASATYNTTAGTTPTAGEIQLQVGKVVMPAMTTAGTQQVTIRAQNSQFLEDSTAGNYANSKWKKIPAAAGAGGSDNVLHLDIDGLVNNHAVANNTAAAAQFKVKYTVSALDDQGKPLGSVYAGDDSVQAGLGENFLNPNT